MQIDKSLPIPLYLQIVETLRSEIADGRLSSGDRLPSEPELVTRYRVSRATAIRALDELAHRGLVSRQRGKGTFVTPNSLDHTVTELSSFSEHTKAAGHTPGQKLVSYTEIAASGTGDDVDAPFPAGMPLAIVVRLRLMDDELVGIHRTAVPLLLARQAGFTQDRIKENASLYAGLQKLGSQPNFGEEWLRAIACPQETAELLECAPGSPLISVRRESRDFRGELVEVVDASYLGHLYRYHVVFSSESNQTHFTGGKNETLSSAERPGMYVGPLGSLRGSDSERAAKRKFQ